LALTACGSPGTDQNRYGGLPSYLPTSSLRPDSVLTGSTGHPALTTEGDTVLVQLPGGSVRATVSGPVVPGEGLPYQAQSTTCTWTVTLTGATTPTPVTLADFSTVDHFGTIYHPGFVTGQPATPTSIAPGQSVTFELQAVMRVGEGLMRWAPGAPQILASWDFEVEND
jgi:hypothetical protein